MPGALFVKGVNYYGRFGINQNVHAYNDWPTTQVPYTRVGTANDWVKVSTTLTHSLALKADGSLWATGYNAYGALGLGDNIDRHEFTRVGTETWLDISANSYLDIGPSLYAFSFGIKSDGTLWGWGQGLSFGGFPSYTGSYNTPILLNNTNVYTKVSNVCTYGYGSFATALLTNDGRLYIADLFRSFQEFRCRDPETGYMETYTDWVSMDSNSASVVVRNFIFRRANGRTYYWEASPSSVFYSEPYLIPNSDTWIDLSYESCVGGWYCTPRFFYIKSDGSLWLGGTRIGVANDWVKLWFNRAINTSGQTFFLSSTLNQDPDIINPLQIVYDNGGTIAIIPMATPTCFWQPKAGLDWHFAS